MNPVSLHWTTRTWKTLIFVATLTFLLYVWVNPQGATVFAGHHADRIGSGVGDGLNDLGGVQAPSVSVVCPDTTFPVIGPCAGDEGPDPLADVRNPSGVAAP